MDAWQSEFVAKQREWRSLINERDCIELAQIRLVGGLDIQWDTQGSAGVGVLAIVSFPECQLVHIEVEHTATDIPWRSGFLGFRECPCYCNLLRKIRHTNLEPQICLVDGFGILHPQGCGSASQLGVQCDFPTIGVAKSLLQPACNMNEKQVKSALDKEQKLVLNLENAAGQVVGCAVRQNLQIKQPVYVSVGHKINLSTACSIVQLCCKFRIPEPIRQADIIARRMMSSHQVAEVALGAPEVGL